MNPVVRDSTRLSPKVTNRSSSFGPNRAVKLTETTVETSVKGAWRRVPALNINGTTIVVKGKWLKISFVHDEEWLKSDLEDPAAIIQGLRKGRGNILSADIFTFSQRLPATAPQYAYPLEWDSIAAIPIKSYKDWWDKLPQETRKNVRRSQKRGVVVRVKELNDDLIRDIVKLTSDSPIRQGKRFVHYGKTFEQIKKDQSSHIDHSDFICAYSEENLIGLLKIVYGKETASVLQFFPKASEQDKRPANALIAKAVEICESKGIPFFIYGKYSYGNKRHSSLLQFKIRNGCQEILVPRYLVPLTLKGVLCLKLGLHRGIIGVLPDRIIKFAVRLRARWYSLPSFLGRCSSVTEQPN